MGRYYYTALNIYDNSYTKGTIAAPWQRAAILKLEQSNFLVINIKKHKNKYLKNFYLFSPISRLDKIYFTRHLYSFVKAGISLNESIKIAADQSNNKKLKKILLDVHSKIIEGESLYASLNYHKKYFSNYFINLIKLGEESGVLEESLEHLLEQQEKEFELLTKVKSALIYPSIIIIAAISVVIFMMVYIVPVITSVFLKEGASLPLPTRILINASSFLVYYGYTILLLILGLFLIIKWAFKTKNGKWIFEAILFKTPIIKNYLIEFNLARFSRSLSALLSSGFAIDKSLKLVEATSGNEHYKVSINKCVELVRRGVPVTEVLENYPDLYPISMVRIIKIGEKTGRTDKMVLHLAKFYEKSIFNMLNNISSVIEPFLILFIGLVVGYIAVSVLLPIWSYVETV